MEWNKDIKFVNRDSRYGRNVFRITLLTDRARAATDAELIDFCDGGPGCHFGGRVQRWDDHAEVSVYID